MTPYYQDASVTLYCADYRTALPFFPRAAAVVTDPPYGETSLDWDVWPSGWPAALAPIAPQLWCFGSMRMFLEQRTEFDRWKLAQDIVWEKQNGSGFSDDRFKRVHEFALHFYQGDWKALHRNPPMVPGPPQRYVRNARPPHAGKIGSFSDAEARTERIMRSVIQVANCHGYAVNETQKPEGIVRPLLEYSVPPGGIVVDCFAGSGTVLAVARQLGMKAVGCEKRESQCAEIVKRIAQGELVL